MVNLFKVLANEYRLEILQILKNPREYFTLSDIEPEVDTLGVCAGVLQRKMKLSQSTMSTFLTSLVKAELLIVTRDGQYTYYKRNEKAIKNLSNQIKEQL
jgi:DNA-binding transcriptional ArsR family regulator